MRLVADANVLLAAIIGGRARLVFEHSEIEEVLTAEATFAEVEEYVAVLARKKRLPLDALLLVMAALPVTIVEKSAYSPALTRARKLIGKRDPDDVDILALALHLRLPIWSNDNDFEGLGIEWYTTAELLKRLAT